MAYSVGKAIASNCSVIAASILQQNFHSKVLQLDEATDISDEVQLSVYCRFADEETKTIVEHYLCSLKVGVCAAAQAIFAKLNQFIEEHGFDWTRCKPVATTAAMQGSTNGLVKT